MKFTLPKILRLEDATLSYQKLWVYKLATVSNLTQSIVGTGIVLWYWSRLPAKVPLWFSRPWGEERLAHPALLLIPILVSVCIYVGNIVAANRYTSQHPLFTRILLLSSTLVSVMSLYIIVRILTLTV